MPYQWSTGEAPVTLTIRPHQSLTPEGLAWFIGPTAALLAVPLVAVLGTPILWVLLGFMGVAVAGVWVAIGANRNHRMIEEELRLWPGRAHLLHRPAGAPPLEWEANPYWVQVRMRPDGGPVENYLTLKGGGREVEIGAFLAPGERAALKGELEAAFARLRSG